MLIKPQTYVNLTGQAVQAVLTYYRILPQDCLVLVDDLYLPFGDIRIRPSGSAGGHNGLKSIIQICGEQFPRIRFGIGATPEKWEQVHWVLRKLTIEELKDLEEISQRIAEIVDDRFFVELARSCSKV